MDRITEALSVGLNQALGLHLRDPDDPLAGVAMRVEGLVETGYGGAHAAAVEALLDVACFLTVIPELDDAEHAVTVAAQFQLIGATPAGSTVVATAHLDRRSSRLAFLVAQARVGEQVVARAQVTKAVVRRR